MHDAAGHRGILPGFQRGNRLQTTAILIPEREPIQEVFDSGQSGPGEIGSTAGPDALQKLQRRRQHIHRSVGNCLTVVRGA